MGKWASSRWGGISGYSKPLNLYKVETLYLFVQRLTASFHVKAFVTSKLRKAPRNTFTCGKSSGFTSFLNQSLSQIEHIEPKGFFANYFWNSRWAFLSEWKLIYGTSGICVCLPLRWAQHYWSKKHWNLLTHSQY